MGAREGAGRGPAQEQFQADGALVLVAELGVIRRRFIRTDGLRRALLGPHALDLVPSPPVGELAGLAAVARYLAPGALAEGGALVAFARAAEGALGGLGAGGALLFAEVRPLGIFGVIQKRPTDENVSIPSNNSEHPNWAIDLLG